MSDVSPDVPVSTAMVTCTIEDDGHQTWTVDYGGGSGRYIVCSDNFLIELDQEPSPWPWTRTNGEVWLTPDGRNRFADTGVRAHGGHGNIWERIGDGA